MLLWALYPPNKRPKIIDVDKAFSHMMRLKVREVDPMVTADIGIDISKFNKAHLKWELAKKHKYKELYEEALKGGGHLVPQITDSSSQWKRKFEKLALEQNKMKKQMKTIRTDVACVFMTRRYENLEKVLDEFWGVYQKNMDNIVCNQRIYDRLNLLL